MAKTFPVIVQQGLYQCSSCGFALRFEPLRIATAEFAIATCSNWHDCGDPQCTLNRNRCKLANVRLRIPIERIECEADEPPGEDWPR